MTRKEKISTIWLYGTIEKKYFSRVVLIVQCMLKVKSKQPFLKFTFNFPIGKFFNNQNKLLSLILLKNIVKCLYIDRY